jgi:tRNA(adenine34) deaminase
MKDPPALERTMHEALAEAAKAERLGEVPVGAVVTLNGKVLGRGHNQPIGHKDPTAHAEIMALREAAQAAGNYRLPGAQLVVTLEPCLMCAGACLHARIESLVFAMQDSTIGSRSSRASLPRSARV